MSTSLDPELTASFTLGPREAKSAVLVLHGFTGTPWEIRPLGETLAQRGFFVHAPRLPGHGTVPEAMLWSGWREWVDAAELGLDALRHFERVCVAGLSMGGLLAMILAARHGPRISKVVLMAPAMKLRAIETKLLRLVRHRRLGLLKAQWVKKEGTDIEDDTVRAQAPVLARYPLSRLFDLFTLQDVAQLIVPLVTQPTLIAAAVHDHVVALDSIKRLHRQILTSRFLLLQRGFHIVPRDTDRALLLAEISEFLDATD